MKMFRRFIIIFTNLIRGENYLFNGDDKLFKQEIKGVSYYGEYGMGRSTIWVARNTQIKKIFSVDTSKVWIDKVKSNIDANILEAKWVNLGRLEKWGWPVDYSKRKNILSYVKSIWLQGKKPQLVLIDGRFRVACFLYSLTAGTPGTKIIFDDYIDRPRYHLVEEFVKRSETCGRQCVFIIPEELDKVEVIDLMNQFLFVMD